MVQDIQYNRRSVGIPQSSRNQCHRVFGGVRNNGTYLHEILTSATETICPNVPLRFDLKCKLFTAFKQPLQNPPTIRAEYVAVFFMNGAEIGSLNQTSCRSLVGGGYMAAFQLHPAQGIFVLKIELEIDISTCRGRIQLDSVFIA